ncbi:MAG: LysR family transcriptional regulator [Nocardiaceae bacterium]|nr:LysR family transcriptional regulator [Nocardiaceae bacterium]
MDGFRAAGAEGVAPLLAAFDAVAAEGHVTRAADLLGVPQSSISRRIRTLERTLGVQLFQQVGRGIALTAQGRDLFERTHRLVSALDDAVDVVRSNADPESGLVSFGFPLTLGPVSIPSVLAEFHAVAPRIRLHLVQAHGDALAGMVRDGRLDLAVMIPPPLNLPVVVLGHQTIHLHVAASHRFARRKLVDLAELADEAFIANPPSYHLRQLVDSWCADAGFTPRVSFEITEFETIRALVGHGLGVALLPAAETPHDDVVAVPLVGARDRGIGLASGHHRPTPAVSRLREHLVARAAVFAGRPLGA